MESRDAAFERSWQELRPQLERQLKRRGAAYDVIDEVLQETSIRLFTAWDRIDRDRPLLPLARTIVSNCLVDLHRGGVRVLPYAEMPDAASGYDLEEHALARTRLSFTAQAIESLAEPDRVALLGEVGLGERGTSSAAKMARLRARKRLLASLDRVAAAFAGVHLGWKRMGLWFQAVRPSGEALSPVIAGVTSVVAAAVMASSPSGELTSTAQKPRLPNAATVSLERTEDNPRAARRGAPGKRPRGAQLQEPVVVARQGQTEGEQPSNPQSSETTVVEAGGANAKMREGRNHRGVEVCTGGSTSQEEDDHEASVNLDTGQGEDSDEGCS